jgi:hypothetical protein
LYHSSNARIAEYVFEALLNNSRIVGIYALKETCNNNTTVRADSK